MSSPKPTTPPWQPQFTIAGIMLVTLLVSVVAAGVSYLFRSKGREGMLIFLLITLAGPLVVMAAISGIRAALAYYLTAARKRKKKL